MRRMLIAAIVTSLALLLGACPGNPPPVVTPPPIVLPPVMCGLVVHTTPGAVVVVADRVSIADAEGRATGLGLFSPGDYLVSVGAEGYLPVKDRRVTLCGQTSVEIALTPKLIGRTGRVRLLGRAFADDQGPYLALGTSLMYGVHATHDGDQLRANLAWARKHGIDFVRVFAETEGWGADSQAGPLSTPAYGAALRALRDAAVAAGLRVEWSIFSDDVLSEAAQRAVVDQLLEVLNETPAAVQLVEVSNENFGFNDPGGPPRMREFAARFVAAGYPTALTSVAHGAPGLYVGSPATLATEHFDRDLWENGWRPVRQLWGYWERTGVPEAFINNEPIGIGSSVAQETDALRLIMGAVGAWVEGATATVVHTGAGIFGVPMVHHVGGARPANLWEQPALEPTLAGIAAMRKILPPDLANWTRANANWTAPLPLHPFTFEAGALGDPALANGRGAVRSYAMRSGSRFVVIVFGIMDQITLTPREALTWTVYSPLDGDLLTTGSGAVTLREAVEGRAVVIIGADR